SVRKPAPISKIDQSPVTSPIASSTASSPKSSPAKDYTRSILPQPKNRAKNGTVKIKGYKTKAKAAAIKTSAKNKSRFSSQVRGGAVVKEQKQKQPEPKRTSVKKSSGSNDVSPAVKITPDRKFPQW